MNGIEAVRTHLRAHKAPACMIAVVVCTALCWLALGRELFIALGDGILINLPPIAPVGFSAIGILVTTPRRYPLEPANTREAGLRGAVLALWTFIIGVACSAFALVDPRLWETTFFNALLFYGIGLGLGALVEPALNGLLIGVFASVLAFVGNTYDGTPRGWAVGLLARGEAHQDTFCLLVFALGFSANVVMTASDLD